MQKLPNQAILLLDNALEEELVKETADGKIRVVYMPPNVTPLIQPMDENSTRLTKLFYRHSLLSKLVSLGNQIQNGLKEPNIFEAVSLIAFAWEKVSQTVLQKCWINILVETKQFEDEDDIRLALLRSQEEVAIVTSTFSLVQSSFPKSNFSAQDLETWNNADKCLIEEGTTSDPEDNTAIDLTDSEEDGNATSHENVKHSDAINAFQLGRRKWN